MPVECRRRLARFQAACGSLWHNLFLPLYVSAVRELAGTDHWAKKGNIFTPLPSCLSVGLLLPQMSADGSGGLVGIKMGSAAERRTFEMIDDEDEQARQDLVKYGNENDKRDMARMGKIQEMRVSFAAACPRCFTSLCAAHPMKYMFANFNVFLASK